MGIKKNKKLLEEELHLLYPNWKKVIDHELIVIYEVPREYSLEEICELKISFSLGQGHYVGTTNKHGYEETIKGVKELWQCDNVHEWDLITDEQKMGDRKARGVVLDTFKVSEDQFYVGARFQVRGDFAPFAGASPIPMNNHAPTYHYLTLAESFKHFRPLVAHDEIFLDIHGVEQAGRAYYLLEKGFRVVSVDKRDTPTAITRDFKEDYLHLQQDFMEMTAKNFRGLPPLDWAVCRLGSGDQHLLEHLLTIMDDNDESKGLMLTFYLESPKELITIRKMIEMIKETSFSHLKTGQVPSHKSEFSIIATRLIGTGVILRGDILL